MVEDELIEEFQAFRAESTEVLAFDLEAHGEKAEAPLNLNVDGFDLAGTVRAEARGVLAAELLLLFVVEEEEPHFPAKR